MTDPTNPTDATGTDAPATPESDAPATDTAPESAPAVKAPRKARKAATRTRTPRKAPEPDPEPVKVRAYNPWTPAEDRKAALAALADRNGITNEHARAAERIRRNVKNYPLGRIATGPRKGESVVWAPGFDGKVRVDGKVVSFPTTPAPQLAQSIGWHDRTVTKVVTTMRLAGSAPAAIAKVIADAGTLSGYGTARHASAAGKAAFAAAAASTPTRTRKAPATRKAASA